MPLRRIAVMQEANIYNHCVVMDPAGHKVGIVSDVEPFLRSLVNELGV